jgi:hypothetical protein
MQRYRKARVVPVDRAPLRGLTPVIHVNASGIAEHPKVICSRESRKARMTCVALSGHSDRLRPFPHVLCKSCPQFLPLSITFDEKAKNSVGWTGKDSMGSRNGKNFRCEIQRW